MKPNLLLMAFLLKASCMLAQKQVFRANIGASAFSPSFPFHNTITHQLTEENAVFGYGYSADFGFEKYFKPTWSWTVSVGLNQGFFNYPEGTLIYNDYNLDPFFGFIRFPGDPEFLILANRLQANTSVGLVYHIKFSKKHSLSFPLSVFAATTLYAKDDAVTGWEDAVELYHYTDNEFRDGLSAGFLIGTEYRRYPYTSYKWRKLGFCFGVSLRSGYYVYNPRPVYGILNVYTALLVNLNY